MSKINQVQSAIRELSGGAFQKFADHYLRAKGYGPINAIGSVAGADKVRTGTPDTLVPLPNGKFVFAEHTTTQQRRLLGKLRSDLTNCFDEEKTGIPIEKIAEVVFCHTSEVSAGDFNGLYGMCREHSVHLSVFGLSALSYDVVEKYPGLARDHLGVEIDTGQIVPANEFVRLYGKSRLATPLDTAFQFREDELAASVSELERGDLVIITGKAGVGKSRLALECCQRFAEAHPKYDVWCIFNRGPDIFNDIETYFSAPGHFLILVDDANRVSGFKYFVQLLLHQREDQGIKIVATVRDYALEKVRGEARHLEAIREVDVPEFDEAQIKQLAEEEYGIRHPSFLDRIADVAQGNPRLAVMAAQVVVREGDYGSINDVSGLYAEYFGSVGEDLEGQGLSSAALLRAAGIVAFFRAVDRTHAEMMEVIEEAFGVTETAFWEAARQLHEMEMLDMYEEEVVRTSDQVLATYFFYLAFFQEKTLDVSVLLSRFFPDKAHRLRDALYPALNAFSQEAMIGVLRPALERAWKEAEQNGHEESLIHLAEAFWFVDRTGTLTYVKEQVDAEAAEPIPAEGLSFEADSNIPSPSILSVLAAFRNSTEDEFEIALSLLLDHLRKQPGALPHALYLLTKRFGFKHESYLRGYAIQRQVVTTLRDHAQGEESGFFSELFLAVAEALLRTDIHTMESKGRGAFRTIRFNLPPEERIFEIREIIWRETLSLFQKPALQQQVLDLLFSYSRFGRQTNADILRQDMERVLPFIEEDLNPEAFHHCLVAQGYFDLLDAGEIRYEPASRARFNSPAYALYQLLGPAHLDRRPPGLSYRERSERRRQQIRNYFSDHGFGDYARLFERCRYIQRHLIEDRLTHALRGGLAEALIGVAQRDAALYKRVLEHYLSQGDPFDLNPYPLVKHLVESSGSQKAWKTLRCSESAARPKWCFSFFQVLPEDERTPARLEQLLMLYQTADPAELPYNIDFLLGWRAASEHVVPQVVSAILGRAETEPRAASKLSALFNGHSETSSQLAGLFSEHVGVLKRAYFSALDSGPNRDYDGSAFSQILDLDSGFIEEYVAWIYDQEDGRVSRYDDDRDYAFLWARDDCEEVVERAGDCIIEREQKKEWFDPWSYLFSVFFRVRRDATDGGLLERQDCFLEDLIGRRSREPHLMEVVFEMAVGFSEERRRRLLAHFLRYNKRLEDFERLPLLSRQSTGSGTFVPAFQAKVDYLKSLLPLLASDADLLRHRQRVERDIHHWRGRIEAEKRRNFMDA